MNHVMQSIRILVAAVPSFAGSVAVVLTIGSLYSDAAMAQEQAERSAQVLEEIVVTARRRNENLQQIPLSVSAFSFEEIELRNVRNLLQLNTLVPNLVISGKGPASGGQEGMFVIRGIGASRSGITDDPRVPLYLDGVYLGSADGALLDVVNLQRIEVLRGPQGTLFGKNALAGAINYVSQQPGEEFGGRAEITYGTFDRLEARGHVDIPFGDSFFTRLAGLIKRDDGNGESVVSGQELGDVDTKFVQGEILWRPSSKFQARLAADYTKHDNNGPVTEILATDDPNDPVYSFTGTVPFLVNLYNNTPMQITDDTVREGEFQNRSASDNFYEHDIWGVRLNLDWDVADWLTIKSLSSYRESNMDRLTDTDGTEYVVLDEVHARDYEQFQQELQLYGVNLDGRLTWVLGGFFFTSEFGWPRQRFIACELMLSFLPCPPPVSFAKREQDSVAVYGEGTFAITDIFSLTAGLRWSEEDITDLGFAEIGGVLISEQEEGTFDEVTPRISLQAQATENLMAYVSYSEGFRSGGHNNRILPTVPNNGFLPYGPETLQSYEIGIKSQFFNDRLQLNAAFFLQDWEDIQVEKIPPGELQNFFLNAGTGEADGFEIEVIALIGEGWRFNVAVGYVDAAYTELDPGVDSVTLDTPFAEAPEWTYTIGGQWDYSPGFGGLLTTRVDWGWMDKRQLNAGLGLAIQDESVGLLRARMVYQTPNGRWEVAGFGNNLTDERYFLTGLNGANAINATAQYARQREWGLTVAVNF